MTGTDALFGQTSDSRIGFWLRRVLALIAGNLVGHRIEAALVPLKDVAVMCANVSRLGLTAAIILPPGHGLMAEPWGA
jgi:hypothetical protein